MKKIIPVVLLLAALFLIPSYSHSSILGAVHMSLIEGDVQINTEDTSEWVAAAINMPLKEGDRIWVPGDGRAELQLNDVTSFRLSESSSLEILHLTLDSSKVNSNGNSLLCHSAIDAESMVSSRDGNNVHFLSGFLLPKE